MIFIKTKYFPAKGFNAITIYPFVFYKKDSKEMRIHEYIHSMQQREMLIVLFFIWYFIEWVIKLFKWNKKAYYAVSFEREAIDHKSNISYYLFRKPFNWIRYV